MLIVIITTGLALLIANMFGQDTASMTSLILYIPVTISLVVVSVIISKRFGFKGDHGKAWILFLIFAILWFIGERISLYYNLTLGEELFPSEADALWLAGYPFLFVFTILYIKPMKEMVTKKIIFTALAISITILTLTLYITYDQNKGSNLLEFSIAIAYPICDSIILVPGIIGMMLFLGGRVNFLWSLMCIAIIFETIADTGYLFAVLDGTYYQGHAVDILFIWYYVIFTFGVYHHITLFKDHKKDPYYNIEDMR